MKRFFRNLNLSKRKIWSIGIITIIFVMSLGYAALSQHMDIEGITVIDKNWIVKISQVDKTTYGDAIESHTYISSTMTLNVELPNANSSVEYIVKVENLGNIVAMLNNIEIIDDNNNSIIYEITDAENGGSIEGGRTLRPQSYILARIRIRCADGVTNISNTKKSIMMTFNFVEDTINSIQDNGYVPIFGQKEYVAGEEVILVDGSKWYVVKDSGSNEGLVTLFAANAIDDCTQFDSNSDYNYNVSSSSNIGYCLNNTYLPKLVKSLGDSGGNTNGISVRLLGYNEIEALTAANPSSTKVSETGQKTWLMSTTDGIYMLTSDGVATLGTNANAIGSTRPVITILKQNINTLVDKILADNDEQSDTNINFGQISSSTNGAGLYYTNTNTEDNKTTYYFRGAVENNYVDFAGYTWRIVRINEDGSVRLILQNTLDTMMYNANGENDNAYVGYMYGTAGASSYDATHANNNNSTVKTYLDNWYLNNISKYSDYIAKNAGFCNDRTVYSGTGYGDSSSVITYYTGQNRLAMSIPHFDCLQSNDLFTTSTSVKGNKSLLYPIGMITADEVIYAGAANGTSNTNFYMNNGNGFWTMTPNNSGLSLKTNIWRFDSEGISANQLTSAFVSDSNQGGVRPVINLNSKVSVQSGNGTKGSPYVIATDENASLVQQILTNNKVQSDNNINLSASSSSTNGQGLYVTSTNTNGNLPTYYFRGNVQNNYVTFAGTTWRIVRINEDGSVRLITQSNVGGSVFNNTEYDNTHAGYMFGTKGATTLSGTQTNKNNSAIKTYLDNWYASNIDSYTKYIADPGFCNDREVSSGLGYGTNETSYAGGVRLYNKTAKFACTQSSSDLFSRYNGWSSLSNSALAYSVGLISYDEIMYAGGIYNEANTNMYLHNGSAFWTMTPNNYSLTNNAFYAMAYLSNSGLNSAATRESMGVRPVINLINGVKITGGNGTSSSPYVIKVS